jgi:hypothetical protein
MKISARAHAWPCAHRGLGGNRVEAVQGDRPRLAERRRPSRRSSSAIFRELWLMSEQEIASPRWDAASPMVTGSGAGEQNERRHPCDLASDGSFDDMSAEDWPAAKEQTTESARIQYTKPGAAAERRRRLVCGTQACFTALSQVSFWLPAPMIIQPWSNLKCRGCSEPVQLGINPAFT